MKRTLLKNGILIDPLNKSIKRTDVLLSAKGAIEKISGSIDEKDVELKDCSGCYISPALVDLHTHTRLPGKGEETRESIEKSALKGGFTNLTSMPNTKPVTDNEAMVARQREMWKDAKINVDILGAITKGEKGETLTPMKSLKNAGCSGFSDDGKWTARTDLLAKALIEANELSLPVFSHTEDEYLPTYDPFSGEKEYIDAGGKEALAAIRDMAVAEMTGRPLHLCHISSKYTLKRAEEFISRNRGLSLETAPHYFSFTKEVIKEDNGEFKVNPPLKTEEDRKYVIDCLKRNVIKVIATDHAPHKQEDKKKGFHDSNPGYVGLETALSAAITFLLKPNYLSVLEIIEKMTVNPLSILKKTLPDFKEGNRLDLIVFSTEHEWRVSKTSLNSQSKNSPFLGMKLRGKVFLTLSKGIFYE